MDTLTSTTTWMGDNRAMTPRGLALAYIDAFCDGDLAALQPLLASGLRFLGPLGAFRSSADYLHALAADPPRKHDRRILSVTEDGNAVAVLREYRKTGGTLTLAQLFRVRGDRIAEVPLVFDGARLG